MTKPTEAKSSQKSSKKTDVSPTKTTNNKASLDKEALTSTQTTTTKTVSFLPLMGFLGISATLALGIYNVTQLNALNQNIQLAQNQATEKNQTALAQFQTDIEDKMQSYQGKLSELKGAFSEQFSQLEHNFKKLNDAKNGDDQTWKLQKTAYLLSMAQLTLHWEKKPTAAIELLTSADSLIKSLNSPLFIGLRHSISNEIVSLKSIPKIDTVGMLNQLSALSSQVEILPLKKPVSEDAVSTQPSTQNSGSQIQSNWQRALNASLDTLSKLIVIRKHQHNYTPLLSQEDKNLVVRQILLGFKQAQWSVLNQSSETYLFSLKSIEKAIYTHFDDTSDKTKSVLSQVKTLMNANISQDLPNINRSYQQVMELINASEKQQKEGGKA